MSVEPIIGFKSSGIPAPSMGWSHLEVTTATTAAEQYYGRFPLVDHDVFEGRERAKYAVGLVGVGSRVRLDADFPTTRLMHPKLALAVGRLRYESYSRLGWIPPTPDKNGAEHDDHDAISLHFGVVANTAFGPRMVGCSRLLLSGLGIALPVEKDYPDLFAQQPPEDRATEISRMITMRPMSVQEIAARSSRAPVKGEPKVAYAALQRVMIGCGRRAGYTCAYGMAEERLIAGLRQFGIPYRQLTDYRPIPEYGNTENAVLFVSPGDVEARTRMSNVHTPLGTRLFFRGIQHHLGQGFYYDKNMVVRRAA